MAKEEITLRDGEEWCRLRLDPMNPEGPARIVDGNVGHAGDTARKPSDVSWEMAAELALKDYTYVAPADLEICPAEDLDGVDLDPEVVRLPEALDSTDHVGPAIDEVPRVLVDDELARQVADATAAEPLKKIPGDSGTRRRASDQVA